MYEINNKGNWVELKKRLRASYPAVSEKDLELTNGSEFDLIIRLQKIFSKNRHEVIRLIDSV